jgi:flagellar biosynthesis/type III secretory pathway protein FliH
MRESSTELPDTAPETLSKFGRIIPASKAKEVLARIERLTRDESRLRLTRQQYLQQITHLRREAQRDGYEQGLALASERTIHTLHKANSLYQDAETQMIDLVCLALEKIVGEISTEIVTPNIVQRALRDLQADVDNITIVVHSELAEVVRAQLETCNEEWTNALTYNIVVDDSMDLLDCRLDCGDSVVEAGLAVQLRAIRSALKTISEPGNDAPS